MTNQRRVLSTCIMLLAVPAFGPIYAKETSQALLRRVADTILEQTTRRLIDRSNGQTFTYSSRLQPKPEISIESKFNAWFYQNWLLTDGMRRTAETLGDEKYGEYGEKNLDFIFKHMPYFEKQNSAGMKAAPIGDGTLSPIGCYFRIGALWQSGLAPLVLERHHATKNTVYEPFLVRMRKFLADNPRFDDGSLYRKGKGMMTDDPYMTVPFLLREWKYSGESKYLDDAIQQVVGTHRRLLDEKNHLLRHLWDLKTQKPAGEFWGRGNGWMVLAQVDLLATLPPTHPRREDVLALFRRHMDGLLKCQDPGGGWHQVLDHPESWIETSCTGMITYGFARGVNEGWLDKSFAEAARRGWKALESKITPENDIIDVCGSTDTGNLAFYLNRPRVKGDLHGFGSVLLAGAEIVRLEKLRSP